VSGREVGRGVEHADGKALVKKGARRERERERERERK